MAVRALHWRVHRDWLGHGGRDWLLHAGAVLPQRRTSPAYSLPLSLPCTPRLNSLLYSLMLLPPVPPPSSCCPCPCPCPPACLLACFFALRYWRMAEPRSWRQQRGALSGMLCGVTQCVRRRWGDNKIFMRACAAIESVSPASTTHYHTKCAPAGVLSSQKP